MGKDRKRDRLLESSPVVIMGRGGSGTRIPSYFLREDLGYFFGNKLNTSGDSIEWKKLSFEIVKVYGGEINLPEDASSFEKELLKTADEILRQGKYPDKWGWKLPHTLLFFPIVAQVFPNSKFIHMIRHPIPSSIGRKRKSDKTSRLRGQGKALLPAAYAYFHKEEILPTVEDLEALNSDSTVLQCIMNAYGWNHQVGRGIEYGREILKDRYLELKYEDCCEEPQRELERICEFIGVRKAPKTSLGIKRSLSPANLEELETYTIDPKEFKKKRAKAKIKEDLILKKKEAGPLVKEICEETAKKIGYEL